MCALVGQLVPFDGSGTQAFQVDPHLVSRPEDSVGNAGGALPVSCQSILVHYVAVGA